MKIIERLDIFIKHKRLSLNAFDKAIGASNGYIGKQIKKKASIGGDVIENIACTYPDLDLNWLITGRGDMIIENANLNQSTEHSPTFEQINKFLEETELEESDQLLIEEDKLKDQIIAKLKEENNEHRDKIIELQDYILELLDEKLKDKLKKRKEEKKKKEEEKKNDNDQNILGKTGS